MAEEGIRVSVAEAKRRLSELISRAAFGKERIVITKRGRPLAVLAPLEPEHAHLADARGWLEDDDPFFAVMQHIVRGRARHAPRVLRRS